VNHQALPRMRFIEEIKRRNVGRVAILYLVSCWLILEPVHVIFHMLEVPVWANRLVIIMMAIGFVPVTIFAWVYETTPDGLKPTVQVPQAQSMRRATGRRLDFAIIVVLAIALGYFAFDKFWLSAHLAHKTASDIEAPGGSTEIDKPIAVLPFADLTEKRDQQYFADGIAGEVIDQLAAIPGLRVTGRSSSFRFRDKALDIRAIGKQLGVGYVLDGSVRRTSDQLRVTAQLIDARDGTQRWSDSYDAKNDNVIEVQNAIASGLARALEVTVRNTPANSRRTFNLAAYDLYLEGLHAEDTMSKENCEAAVAAFEEALSLDPTFAQAAVGLARANTYIGLNGWSAPKIAFEKARAAAQRALAIDPKNAVAHAALGDVNMVYDWDWAASAREMSKALELGIREPYILETAARLATTRGDWDKALGLARSAVAQDPLSATAHMILGWSVYARTDRFAEAEKSIKRGLEIDPQWGTGRFYLTTVLLMQNRQGEALVEAQKATPEDARFEALALAYHALGRNAESDSSLDKAIEIDRDGWASGIAKVYAFRGELDKAMEWLELAYIARDADLFDSTGDPLFRNLKHDQRYSAFLGRLKLPMR
jgi:adenylate cyclase